jgi:DNA repair exonuclease SbcCD nuclease subunit
MIYVSADNHLADRIWRRRRDLDGDSYAAFNRLADSIVADVTTRREEETKLGQLVASSTDTLLLAGDIFDTRKVNGACLQAFKSLVDKLAAVGVRVLTIQGNHDMGAVPIPEVHGAERLTTFATVYDNRKIVGLDWLPREELKAALEEIGKSGDKIDILVLHCAFEHLLGFAGSFDISMSDIPANVKHVVVGDVHTVSAQKLPNSDGYCVSPGATHPCKLSEGGEHGYYKIPFLSEEWEFVPIPSRQVIRVGLQDESDIADWGQMLAKYSDVAEDLKPLMEIKFETKDRELVDKFIESHKGQAIFFDNGYVASKMRTAGAVERAKESMTALTLRTALNSVVPEESEDFVFIDTLLSAPNAAEIIDKEVEAILETCNT